MKPSNANLQNLSLVRTALEGLNSRASSLPGIAVMHGPAGYGKTTAAMVVGNETRAYFVQVRSAWGRKTLLQKIAAGRGTPNTIPDLLEAVCGQLATSGRLLILDEFDYCLKNETMVDLVRDIYEGAQQPILGIGMEMLPQKLKRWEQFHSRVYTWIPAQPVSLEDARLLAPVYCDVPCADDFLSYLVGAAAGSVRRVSVNLAQAGTTAAIEGWRAIDRATWGNRSIYTGESPMRELPTARAS
jgi:DNA transposition AAA+ family ATPase